MSPSTNWDPSLALEQPELFLHDYFEVMGRWRDHRDGKGPKLTPDEDAAWNILFEAADEIVKRSPFTETLDFLRTGLQMCETDRDLAFFAAGPLEDFVVHRLKSEDDVEEFRAAMRQDPTLMRTFKEGMVWGLDAIPERARKMLNEYLPRSS